MEFYVSPGRPFFEPSGQFLVGHIGTLRRRASTTEVGLIALAASRLPMRGQPALAGDGRTMGWARRFAQVSNIGPSDSVQANAGTQANRS
jgi:hypothetical protein